MPQDAFDWLDLSPEQREARTAEFERQLAEYGRSIRYGQDPEPEQLPEPRDNVSPIRKPRP